MWVDGHIRAGVDRSGPQRRSVIRRKAIGRALLPAVVSGVLVAAACSSGSGDDDGGDAAQDEAASEATSTSADPRSGAVLEAYEAYWTAFLEAADPPAPDSEQLAEHATGDELERVQSAIADLEQAGDVLRGSYEHNASVTSIEDDQAVVADCLAPRTTTVDAASGDVVVGESSGSGLVTVQMSLDGDAWKVASIEDGEGACPPAGQAPAAAPTTGG